VLAQPTATISKPNDPSTGFLVRLNIAMSDLQKYNLLLSTLACIA